MLPVALTRTLIPTVTLLGLPGHSRKVSDFSGAAVTSSGNISVSLSDRGTQSTWGIQRSDWNSRVAVAVVLVLPWSVSS